MAMIRPTLILNIDLDERSWTDELAADLRRAYTHVAATQVKSRPACSEAAESVIRLNVKLRSPYWDDDIEGASEQWASGMPKWLGNVFYKVSSNMLAFNRMRTDRGDEGMCFSWMEIALEGDLVLAIRLNADSSIPENALEMVEKARALYNEGALGTDLARISIPSAGSYAAQAALHTVRCEAEETVLDADAAENANADSPEGPADAASVVEPFDIDFSVWGLTRTDGASEEIEA